MSNKILHFSNSGISSGQRFYLKDDVSGIFLRNLNIDSNFPVVASNLVYNTGNQNVSGIKSFYSRPTVNGTGVLLSGEAASLSVTIVYTTGNQTISGTKTFANNLEVQGTGIFNALDLSNISEFNFSGTNINLISGNVNISGQIYISGNPVLTEGSIPFVMNFGHSQIGTVTTGLTTGYFGIQGDAGIVTLNNNEKRRVPILQNCFLRKVAWTNFAKNTIPSGMLTGYFKNFGSNPFNDDKTVGVQVTPGMSIPATNILYNSITGNLNLPIKTGDYVSFYYVSNFSGASTVNHAVNVGAYFYV